MVPLIQIRYTLSPPPQTNYFVPPNSVININTGHANSVVAEMVFCVQLLSLIPFDPIYTLLGGLALTIKFLVGGPKSIYRNGGACGIGNFSVHCQQVSTAPDIQPIPSQLLYKLQHCITFLKENIYSFHLNSVFSALVSPPPQDSQSAQTIWTKCLSLGLTLKVPPKVYLRKNLVILYQIGGGVRPYTNFLENFPNIKFVRGSPVPT